MSTSRKRGRSPSTNNRSSFEAERPTDVGLGYDMDFDDGRRSSDAVGNAGDARTCDEADALLQKESLHKISRVDTAVVDVGKGYDCSLPNTSSSPTSAIAKKTNEVMSIDGEHDDELMLTQLEKESHLLSTGQKDDIYAYQPVSDVDTYYSSTDMEFVYLGDSNHSVAPVIARPAQANHLDTSIDTTNDDMEQCREKLRWFEAFQRILSLPAQDRGEELDGLIESFLHTAKTVGKKVIEEHGMDKKHREIKELNVSGVAGGLKYYAHGIIFKFAVDTVGIYGGETNAKKAARHELRGLNAIHSAGVSVGIGCQLMTIIDFLGFRLSAYSYLPIVSRKKAFQDSHLKSTLVYGSEDAGRHIFNEDSELDVRMKHVADVLRLKRHRAGVEKRQHLINGSQELYGPLDMEGHSINGKFYILDPARLFPPTWVIKGASRNSIYYHQFRPEFLQLYKIPLSSDALSPFGYHNHAEHNAEVESAYKVLEIFISQFAQSLATMRIDGRLLVDAQPRTVKHHVMLIEQLHINGINIRYLMCVRDEVKKEGLANFISIQMIARVVKDIINERMRLIPKHMAGAELSSSENVTWDKQTRAKVLERAACTTICECFNQLFGDKSDPANTEFWKKIVKEIDVKFPDFWGYRTPPTDDQEIQQRIEEYRGVLEGCEKELFVVLSHMLALTWSEVDVDQQLQSEKPQLDPKCVLEIRCKVREIYAVPRMQADSLWFKARGAQEIHKKISLYDSAIQFYRKSLQGKPDDQSGLINHANALADLASIYLHTKNVNKAEQQLRMAEKEFEKCWTLNDKSFLLLRSWANVLLTQARGMMLAASDRDNKLELIKCAKRCLVRSGKLFERIFSHNLCPDAHKYNVTVEFTSETLTAVDIWSRLGESKGERLSLLERAEKLAKWSVKMAPDEVGGLQNLGAVLIDIAKLRAEDSADRKAKLKEAATTFHDLESKYSGDGSYNLTCVYSLLHDHEKARLWLERAYSAGKLTADYLRHDEDFDNVRNTNWFKRIQTELEQPRMQT